LSRIGCDRMSRIATGKVFEQELPASYVKMEEDAKETISRLLAQKPKARKMWSLLKRDAEAKADWDLANYIAVSKLRYNDHGEIHAKIVAANALKMLKLLLNNGVTTKCDQGESWRPR